MDTLIIGAGAAGVQLLRELKFNKTLDSRIIGFVDDNPRLKGKKIHNVPILGNVDELPKILNKTNTQKVFLAIPSATSDQIRRIIGKIDKQIELKSLPMIEHILDGKVNLSQLKEIDVNDLLGRDPVQLYEDSIQPMIKEKVVMVTGAGGSIGSEICIQLAKFSPRRLILFEQSEFNLYTISQLLNKRFPEIEFFSVIGDVRNKKKVDKVFNEYRPELVFHAAAYKHVPMMETNPYEAVETNVFGTKNLAGACLKYGAEKFVLISTDKAVNPTNIMGATKRIAEQICQSAQESSEKTKFVTVRFGNVLGSSGSVIPLFKKQIEEGGPLTVTHREITRYFMSIPEASQLVLQAGALGNLGEVFVLDMGESVRIFDLAAQMIKLSGLGESDIEIKIVGLRAGEKLYEELLCEEETILPTSHPKVKVAKVSVDLEKLNGHLNHLRELDEFSNRDEFIQIIEKIVPEYTPYND